MNHILIKNIHSIDDMYKFINKYVYTKKENQVDVDYYAGIINKPNYWYNKEILGVVDCKEKDVAKLLEQQEQSLSVKILIISIDNE